MSLPAPQLSPNRSRRRYRWPWILLAAVLLGIVLAFLWLSSEVQRTRRYRQWNAPQTPVPTNAPR